MSGDRLDERTIAEALRMYERERDRFLKLTAEMETLCRRAIEAESIRSLVTSRTKQIDSLQGKLERYLEDGDERKLVDLGRADLVLLNVGDLSAVRVATYRDIDRGRAVAVVRTALGLPPTPSDETEVLDKPTGYSAVHIDARLPASHHADGRLSNVQTARCEVQVCGMFTHLWNEVEHDIRYKTGILDSESDEERLALNRLRQIVTSADEQVMTISEARAVRVARTIAERIVDSFPKLGRVSLEEASYLLAIQGVEDIETHRRLLLEARDRKGPAWEEALRADPTIDAQPDTEEAAFLASVVRAQVGDLSAILDDFERLARPAPFSSFVVELIAALR